MASTRHVFLTGNGAIDYTLTPGVAYQLEELRLHLGAASGTSETLTTTIVSAAGSEYNTVLDSQDINGLADYVFQATRPHPFVNGDKLRFLWANANGNVWGLELIFRGI